MPEKHMRAQITKRHRSHRGAASEASSDVSRRVPLANPWLCLFSRVVNAGRRQAVIQHDRSCLRPSARSSCLPVSEAGKANWSIAPVHLKDRQGGHQGTLRSSLHKTNRVREIGCLNSVSVGRKFCLFCSPGACKLFRRFPT